MKLVVSLFFLGPLPSSSRDNKRKWTKAATKLKNLAQAMKTNANSCRQTDARLSRRPDKSDTEIGRAHR